MLNNYFLKNYSDGQSSVKVEAGLAQTILEAKRQGLATNLQFLAQRDDEQMINFYQVRISNVGGLAARIFNHENQEYYFLELTDARATVNGH